MIAQSARSATIIRVHPLTREAALAESGMAPVVTGYHHFAPTVSDVEASAQWYERVFGMTRVPLRSRIMAGRRTATPLS